MTSVLAGLMGAIAARRRPSLALLSLLDNTPVTGVGRVGVSCPALSPKPTPNSVGWSQSGSDDVQSIPGKQLTVAYL